MGIFGHNRLFTCVAVLLINTAILAAYPLIRGNKSTLNPAPVTATYLWFVYLLECLNGKIYTGIITNIEVRFNKHLAGKGAKFTKMNPHSYIMAIKQCRNRSEASKLEDQIKQLTPDKKRVSALIWNEINQGI
ncbi:GIY-YIG nuclease family protein [Methylobacter tundripaludum]|uniref:GIY-YIG nuclease family protein n=1 Tax=Methylobacter tundripaludum TaxID=173365 RepID=UPI0009DFD739|nr:GIY-YIG nuclease family protein [Methylobacter tundripaludum]